MKTTKTGYRLNKNGAPISTIEKDAIIKTKHCGKSTKENGEYYFFDRKQGEFYIYLP